MTERLRPGVFLGHSVKCSKIADLILTESSYAARTTLPRHAHENSYFCFSLDGSFTEHCGSREVVYTPSALTFREASLSHRAYVHDAEARVFTLELDPRWIDRLREDSLTLQSRSEFCSDSASRLCARINFEFHRTDQAAKLALEGLTLELLADVARQRLPSIRTVPLWLKRAREIIRERFADDLTPSAIAGEVGVHPVYLSTAFRQKFGVTLGEYVRRLRIEHACTELGKGDLPLAAIASQAGFADQSHFSKTFKLYVGITPNEYRRRRKFFL